MNWWVLCRRLHVSWLIAIVSVALVIGVWWAKYVPPTVLSSPVWAVVASVWVVIVLLRRYMYLIPVLICAGLLLGLWRGSLQNNEQSVLESVYGKTITVIGSVREDVDTDTSGHMVIRLNNLQINGQSQVGSLWVTTKTDVDIKRSDLVTFEGKLVKGFGSFVGAMYQANIISVKRPQPGDVARVVRDWFSDSVRSAIPSPQSSLGIGYLVGQKRALPTDLVEALQIAGLTHVVVASGYNLTILVRLARRLFEKVSKYLSALSSGLMIFGFVAVTGLSPSMSRAAFVAGFSLAAWYYGRRFHPLVLLSFAAVATVIINPSYVWGDLGWQLSFAAFAGVMILAPLLQRYFFGEKKPSFVRQILGETISAVIVTAPLLIGSFGQLSNVAIIANLLVLPLVPLAMLLTFIAGIGSVIIPALATFIGLPATWLLGYMISVAQYLSHISWAVTTVQLSPAGIGICYIILVAVCVYLWRITKYDLTMANIVE